MSGIPPIAAELVEILQGDLAGRAFCAPRSRSNVDLLRYRNGIVNLDAKVSYGTLDSSTQAHPSS